MKSVTRCVIYFHSIKESVATYKIDPITTAVVYCDINKFCEGAICSANAVIGPTRNTCYIYISETYMIFMICEINSVLAIYSHAKAVKDPIANLRQWRILTTIPDNNLFC